MTGAFHDHLSLTRKTFKKTCQFSEFSFGVSNIMRFSNYNTERLHNSNRAFSFGNINSYCILWHTPVIMFFHELVTIFLPIPIQSVG